MKNITLTKDSFEIIVSTLIGSKIKAERNNEKGINDAYIESVTQALKELQR